MNTITRRAFGKQVGALLAGGAGAGLLGAAPQEKRERLPVAAVVTEYRRNSHADVIVGKILEGFSQDGGAGPSLRLAALYTDQVPKSDLSRDLAKKYKFRIAGSIEEAITLGGARVAVAGVLSIGEHGTYPRNQKGQHEYPRKRFFDEIVKVFRRSGRSVPVFNDKHLSYRWDWAREMVDTSNELRFPLMAGSSVPLAQRRPAMELPRDAVIREAVSIHGGGLESYDFHALEVLQSVVEHRQGREGQGDFVAAFQAYRDYGSLPLHRDEGVPSLEDPAQKVPPVVGEKQTDPTHSAVLGMKLAEKLKEVGVEVILAYPDKRDPKYKNANEYLLDRLKK